MHSEERVRKAVQKFAKLKSTATQGRLDSFFKVLPKDPSSVKRKVRALLKSRVYPQASDESGAKKKTATKSRGKPRR